MNKKLLVTGLIAAASLAQGAQADERWPRWYVGLSGGVTFLGNTDIKGAESGKVDYNTGGMGTVSLGYMPPIMPLSNVRIEAELGYHYNSLDSASVNGAPVASSGALQAVSYMGNLYYDFRNGTGWTPYVGAGLGGARVTLSRTSGLGNTSDGKNVLAYQFMTGLSYAPTTIPMTEWSLGYRYFSMNNPDFSTAAGKIKLDSPMEHNVELGAKFRF